VADPEPPPTRELYRGLNERVLGTRLIVWPESALPELANDAQDFLRQVYGAAHARGSDILMGVVRADGDDYYNSILALGDEVAFYDKRHLVPFAEYFPVPAFVRSWLRLLSLPYSDFNCGRAAARRRSPWGLRAAATIAMRTPSAASSSGRCGRQPAGQCDQRCLVGRSPARFQHFQIARLRARERPLPVRALNDGLSAVVGPKGGPGRSGGVPADRAAGNRAALRGLTPYARAGNGPVVAIGLFAGTVRGLEAAVAPRRLRYAAARGAGRNSGLLHTNRKGSSRAMSHQDVDPGYSVSWRA
jgi:apolipoprotein N-acyltransferase